MRKMMLLAVMVALAAMMLAAAPAMADDRDGDGHDDDFCDKNDEFCEDFEKDFSEFFEEFCEDSDGDLVCDFDGFFQTSDQQAESGDIDQSFDISGSGANSNQCVGVQGVANTGNAQNTINVFNLGGEDVEFEFDEVGSTIDVSPVNTTTCDQEVNQAAVAHGGWW